MTTPADAPNMGNIRIAVNGAIRKALVGTTAPTNSTATYAAGWTNLGYISEDGFTESDDVDTEDVVAWQNGTLVRRIISSQEKTFEFACLESKPAVLELRHPGSVVTAGAMAVKALTSGLYFALAFDTIDGAITERIIVPRCEATDFEDIEHQNAEATTYGVTVTVYPDDTQTLIYKYSNSPAWTA